MHISVYNKGVALILVCCLFLVTVLACPAPAPPPPPPPAPPPPPPPERPAFLAVTPAGAKAGAVIKLTGSGFLPDEEVEVIMFVGDIRHALGTLKVDKIVADKDGKFSVDSGIPVGTPPGEYLIKARGNKGSKAMFFIKVLP